MKEWLKISLLLSMFGFLKEIRPSEPFIFEFLIGPWRNITQEQVNQDVYPIGSYSYLAQLLVVFLITDLCRYKALIIVLGLAGITVWSMLLWTTSLLELQILEIVYGTFMATEVAYYTYIYAKVKQEHFQKVTSHTRAAILAGRLTSGILGQILISTEVMNYRDLNFITLAALIVATAWSLFLPPVKETIYFHQTSQQQQLRSEADGVESLAPLKAGVVGGTARKFKEAFGLMGHHFVNAYSNAQVVKWSIWWALATCGFIQVQIYVQPLWTATIDDAAEPIYNGAVEAILTFFGTAGALLAGVLHLDWHNQGALMLAICSILQGATQLIASQVANVFISYACYVVFGALYHFMVTVVSTEIAKQILEDSYGLVFGLNTFIALGLQSLMTLTLVTGYFGLELRPRHQFLCYGMYHMATGAIYIGYGLVSWFTNRADVNKSYIT